MRWILVALVMSSCATSSGNSNPSNGPAMSPVDQVQLQRLAELRERIVNAPEYRQCYEVTVENRLRLVRHRVSGEWALLDSPMEPSDQLRGLCRDYMTSARDALSDIAYEESLVRAGMAMRQNETRQAEQARTMMAISEGLRAAGDSLQRSRPVQCDPDPLRRGSLVCH